MVNTVLPLVSEFPYRDPSEIFSYFSADEGAVFLDSAQLRAHCGRYSFIAWDPFQMLSSKNGVLNKNGAIFVGDPFEVLRKELSVFSQETLPGLPPFQGGAAGYLGYELAQHLERVPLAPVDDMQFPDLALGFYDLVLGFDLEQKRAWVFSTGFPQQAKLQRQERAQQRLAQALQQLENFAAQVPPAVARTKNKMTACSDFSPQAYQEQVQKVRSYILAGDIFEANLSQRFCAHSLLGPPFDLYRRLRKINPAPFAAYFNMAGTIIASASPERFIKLAAGLVETRPIKGTRPRGKSVDEDERLAQELLSSEKDRAENVMIVDLLRNDLSRVCAAHSVKVPQLCGLESYPTVHHLVSVVTGKLQQNYQAIDLLKAAFPGGSITGAPKLRAMEIIAELEPTQRGPYCGSMAYFGFDGNMDSSILIRTFCIKNNKVSFQAGGAIVVDSDPQQEQEEVLTKARALLQALGSDHDFID